MTEPEQIEIIRAKFEKLHPVPSAVYFGKCGYSLDIYESSNVEIAWRYQSKWEGFLSAMTQEIWLPALPTGLAISVVEALNKQGYTVTDYERSSQDETLLTTMCMSY